MPFVRSLAIALACACATGAYAAPVSPIKLEKLLTGKGQWRLDTSVIYAPGFLTTAGVGTTGQNLPVATEVQGLDINTLAFNATLSYGLQQGTELSIGGSRSMTRTANTLPPYGSETNSQWDGLTVGLSQELYSNAKEKMSIVGSASLDLARPVRLGTGETHRVHGRSGTLGVTVNKVVDPMVLSLQATYAHGVSGTFQGEVVRDPSVWSVSPSVTFQANERIGLGWGAQFSRIGARVADLGEGIGVVRIGAQTQTSFLFTMNYQLSKDAAVVASYSFPTLQNAAPVFTLRYLTELDM